MVLFLFGLLSIGSLFYFYRLSQAEKTDERVWFRSYQLADAIFATLLGLFFLYVIYLSFAQSAATKITTAVLIDNAVFSLLLVGGVALFLALRSRNPITVFGLRKLTWKGTLLGLLGLVIALPVIYFSYSLALLYFGADTKPQPLLQFFMSPTTSISDRLLLIFTAVVVAPVSEEVIFRGYFYGVMRRYGGRWPAIILSAVLFGAIHVHPPALIALAVLAVALTLVYERTGSLWAPMLMHACFNSATLVVSTLWPNLGS